MRNITSSFIIALASLLIPLTALADGATAAQKSAAGKRIIGTAKTEAALGFKLYPGAMLKLTDSVDDCADAKGDRTSFIYGTLDTLASVKAFYGMGARDNKLDMPEAGRSLTVTSDSSGTRIAIRHFPPKEPKAAKPGKK
jgi:hypothetical protein